MSVPVNMTPDIPGSPICSEDRAAGKFIALPQEISADPWRKVTLKEGNDLGVKLAEKSDGLVVARKRLITVEPRGP